jgi:hypothetical protein
LLKGRKITEHCHKKSGVELSVVFVIVRFQIVLNVFGETNRCRQKRRVKLCTFGSIQHIQRRSGCLRCQQTRRVKLSVFHQ